MVGLILADRKAGPLWAGDTSVCGGNASRADAALVIKLLYYTGGDREQVDRLFRLSGLFRDKWDSRRGASTAGNYGYRAALS